MNESPDSQQLPPESSGANPEDRTDGESTPAGKRTIWPQFRRLLVFQLKLYIDALRDLIMSPMSVVVFLLDVIQGNKGDKALFESLMQFGRKTERAINLFDQHDTDDENYRGVDSLLGQVEELVRKEYADGSVSANARDSIETSLKSLRGRIRQTRQDTE